MKKDKNLRNFFKELVNNKNPDNKCGEIKVHTSKCHEPQYNKINGKYSFSITTHTDGFAEVKIELKVTNAEADEMLNMIENDSPVTIVLS